MTVVRKRITPEHLNVFTRQFADALDDGRPLVEILAGIARQQTRPAFKKALLEIQIALWKGEALANAMAAQPAYFDAAYVEMVRESCNRGELDLAMRRFIAAE